MRTLEEIDADIKKLYDERKAVKDFLSSQQNQKYIEFFGKEVFDILDDIKGIGKGKLDLLMTMKNVSPEILASKFPLLSKVDKDVRQRIADAINRH